MSIVPTNRFAGPCSLCGLTVEANEGIRPGKENGRWVVQHIPGRCPEAGVHEDVAMSNAAAALEREQEAAAFMADVEDDGNAAEEWLAVEEWRADEEARAAVAVRVLSPTEVVESIGRARMERDVIVGALRLFALSETISDAEREVARDLLAEDHIVWAYRP